MFEYIWLQLTVLFGLMYQESYNSQWDSKLNKLIDNEWEVAKLDLYECDAASLTPKYHTLSFSSTTVWVCNRYYSYGYAYDDPCSGNKHEWWEKCRPKASTMLKLNRLVRYKLAEHKKNILKERN